MSEQVLGLLVFGSALVVLLSGIPIWAGLSGISLLYIVIFEPHLLSTVPTCSTTPWTASPCWPFRSSFS